MDLFRQPTTRYKLGKQNVRKGTPGAVKVTEYSRKWYGKIRQPTGKWQAVPLSTDKSVAKQLLTELRRKADRVTHGLEADLTGHLNRPLAEHLAEYRSHLNAKGNCVRYVEEQSDRVAQIIAGCDFVTFHDLTAHKVTLWLHRQRQRKFKPHSLTTSNNYRTAIVGFVKWLHADGRAPRNPLLSVKPLNAEVALVHLRRSLSPIDFQHLLIPQAAKSETFWNSWKFSVIRVVTCGA